MDLGQPFPPDFLPCIPTTAFIHMPRDDPSDGLVHGLCRFPHISCKSNTGGIDDIIPEVGSNLNVLLTQIHPSIELSVTSRDRHASNLLLMQLGFSPFPVLSPSSLGHVPTAQVSVSHTITTLQ